MTALRIGDRVRFVLGGPAGTIAANSYSFHGVVKASVTWDNWTGVWVYPVSILTRLRYRPSVPPEARPLSVGALASPERRPR